MECGGKDKRLLGKPTGIAFLRDKPFNQQCLHMQPTVLCAERYRDEIDLGLALKELIISEKMT